MNISARPSIAKGATANPPIGRPKSLRSCLRAVERAAR